jgi:hypothetical protein
MDFPQVRAVPRRRTPASVACCALPSPPCCAPGTFQLHTQRKTVPGAGVVALTSPPIPSPFQWQRS